MVPKAYTVETWLAHLLAHSHAGRPAPNVRLHAPGGETRLALEDGEQLVASVTSEAGREYLLTCRRLVAGGATLCRYAEVARCGWEPVVPRAGRDRVVVRYAFRLVLELADGGRVALEGLGQAGHPLNRFFASVAGG